MEISVVELRNACEEREVGKRKREKIEAGMTQLTAYTEDIVVQTMQLQRMIAQKD